jgi:heptaprenyl diphosphate synthase
MDGACEARSAAAGDVSYGVRGEEGEDLAGFLMQVEGCLARALAEGRGGAGLLGEAGRHLGLAPGAKRARPMMAYFLGQLLGVRRGLVEVAAAVELIHTASLLHDDVVDAASWRRGRLTVNARWGSSAAVLAGDWVLTAALRLLRPLGEAIMGEAVEVVAEMSVAAALEVEGRGSLGLGVDGWMRMAEGKTGALFGLVGACVGALSADTKRAQRLARAGRHLGVAFQVMDDLADLTESDAETPYQDLREGNPSFPVLWAAAASPAVAASLLSAWERPAAGALHDPLADASDNASDDARFIALARAVQATGAPDAARAVAWRAVEEAAAAFGSDLHHPCVRHLMRWADALTLRRVEATPQP